MKPHSSRRNLRNFGTNATSSSRNLMKASSSTNSLTSLTIDIDPECIVCLDSGLNAQGERVLNPLMLHLCGCRFTVHPKCWTDWVQARNMCPICRRPIIVSAQAQSQAQSQVQAQNQTQVQVPVLVLADADDNDIIKSRLLYLFCILLLIIIGVYFVYGK